MNQPILISELMEKSGVKFGTSGARGLVKDMSDEVCYCYTLGFIQHLEAKKELLLGESIGISGDLRPSTERIMRAVLQAIQDKGYRAENLGKLPSPAVALAGLNRGIATIMVTGSHIPEDRNGIKYTKKEGEILKSDEAEIKNQRVEPKALFDKNDMLVKPPAMPEPTVEARKAYIDRYVDFFSNAALRGKKVGVYQHSAVGRDLMVDILEGVGAEVEPLKPSDQFIPVDTEAIRPEDVRLALQWSHEYGFDAIVSTDGDSDRPLVANEFGKWLRGDVAGILCAFFLKADAVVIPVSCNSAVESSGFFKKVIRTRIGSPFVISGMKQALQEGYSRVVGYEANGGFLTASPLDLEGKVLAPLPTRDALLVQLALLRLSKIQGKTISQLVNQLPPRYTYSDRLKNFPTEKSQERLSQWLSESEEENLRTVQSVFEAHFGPVQALNTQDGLRIMFDSGDIVHLRPSGNAPEFRCYTESDTEERARMANGLCLKLMETWR